MNEQITSGSAGAEIARIWEYVAAKEKILEEYNNKKEAGWLRFYKEICEACDRTAKENHFTTYEAERSQNRVLNRYRDVSPYDQTRVLLKRGKVDYINANLVKMERACRQYILTQGPLVDTVGHFWLMVWEQNSRAILMLNKLIEKKQVKCHLYWPDELGADKALKLDAVKLSVELVRCETYRNFVRRWFKLTDLETQTSREVLQFHYTTWPDFGLPSSPDAFLKFLQLVRDSGALDKDVGPAVVHCSAGIGRSGTFCLVDCCLVLVANQIACNVSNVLCELRTYRMGLIQTADQLDFSYKAIIEGITKLQDTDFLNEEEPLVCNDTDAHTLQDEQPPPLPPRTHSLNLPLAPSAGGVLSLNMPNGGDDVLPHDDNMGDKKTPLSTKDALNNFINKHQHVIVNAEVADSLLSERPLPPLPTPALNRVQESDSDNDEELDDDDVDDDDDDDDDDDADDDNVDDEDEEYENINTGADLQRTNGVYASPATANTDDVNANSEKATEQHELRKINGIEVGQHLATSPDNELKRRKRNDYQASLEQKVNEIKRKKRENEDNQQAAKKRRSLLTYIAAGVVVGVICAYAYTKLG